MSDPRPNSPEDVGYSDPAPGVKRVRMFEGAEVPDFIDAIDRLDARCRSPRCRARIRYGITKNDRKMPLERRRRIADGVEVWEPPPRALPRRRPVPEEEGLMIRKGQPPPANATVSCPWCPKSFVTGPPTGLRLVGIAGLTDVDCPSCGGTVRCVWDGDRCVEALPAPRAKWPGEPSG